MTWPRKTPEYEILLKAWFKYRNTIFLQKYFFVGDCKYDLWKDFFSPPFSSKL